MNLPPDSLCPPFFPYAQCFKGAFGAFLCRRKTSALFLRQKGVSPDGKKTHNDEITVSIVVKKKLTTKTKTKETTPKAKHLRILF